MGSLETTKHLEILDASQNESTNAKYDKEIPPKVSDGKFDDGQCSICLTEPQVDKSFPPCGHVYCFNCLVKWSQQKQDCPTCKQPFLNFRYSNGKKLYDVAVSQDRPVKTQGGYTGTFNPRNFNGFARHETFAQFMRVSQRSRRRRRGNRRHRRG